MPKYKITHGFIKMGEGPENMKGVGEIVELDAEKGDAIVESGCAERVKDAPKPEPKAEEKGKK